MSIIPAFTQCRFQMQSTIIVKLSTKYLNQIIKRPYHEHSAC